MMSAGCRSRCALAWALSGLACAVIILLQHGKVQRRVTGFPSLYGLYRLLLWMKQRGWLSRRNQCTDSSAISCFVAMQQFCVQERQHRRGEEDSPAAE